MYAGFSKIDITPEPGLPMAGYVNRSGKGIGAHDPLYARTLYLSSSNVEVVLVFLDIIRIDEDLKDKLTDTIVANHGLKSDNVFLAATHTHSGPEISLGLWSTRELGEDDKVRVKNYVDELVWKVNNSVSKAIEHAERVKDITVTSTIIDGVATNRIDGSSNVDREAVVLEITHGHEKTIVVNYACHPTVLGPDNLLYSGDLAGLTVKYIEDNIGVNAIYANGAAGNVSTRFSRSKQDFGEAFNLSKIISEAVISSLLSDNIATRLGETISVVTKSLKLRLREPVDQEKLDELEKQLVAKLHNAKRRSAPPSVIRALESDVYAIRIAKRRNYLLKNTRSIEVELKLLNIGGLPMIFFPGELFVEYQLEVKNQVEPRKAMIIGYANGYIGYIPHPSYSGRLCYEEIVSLIDSSEYHRIRSVLGELLRENNSG